MLDRQQLHADELEIGDIAALDALYVSIHGEGPTDEVRRRFSAVLRKL